MNPWSRCKWKHLGMAGTVAVLMFPVAVLFSADSVMKPGVLTPVFADLLPSPSSIRRPTRESSAVTSTQEIKEMGFRRRNNEAFKTVSLPHTMNAANGTGTIPLERGDGYYKYELNVSNADLSKDYIIQFEQVGQVAEVFLNGTLLHKNYSGYTPFAVKLQGLKAGKNEITIHTNNRNDSNNIPNSGDFNFCNGIYGKAFLISGSLYFDPLVYGIDKAHIVPVSIGKDEVKFGIATSLFRKGGALDAAIRVTVTDAEGKSIVSASTPFAISAGANEFYKEFSFQNPILWQGLENPYLYDVSVEVVVQGRALDKITIPYGFRDIQLPYSAKDNRLSLNGQKVTLRGVSLHQDAPGVAAALTDEDRARDQEIMKELGFNWLRCAHYPHNVNEFKDYDRMGLMCQTEIPWVNGYTAGQAYADHVMQYTHDMINNLYNHPSIILWGLSNEIFYSWSNDACVELHNKAYQYARRLDPYRFVGFVAREQEVQRGSQNGLIADWYGNNPYPGWYSKTTFENTKDGVAASQMLAKFYMHGITEYGYGGNPFQHNSDFMTLHPGDKRNKTGTSNDTGGWLHPEEYQTLGHIYSWNKIAGTPEGRRMTFTSLWILFDFAVGSRNEGNTPGINDKGLVTRDRKTKKDAFYFYKCVWNKAPEVHIMSSRWTERDTKDIAITVFSNGDKVELFRNGEKIQTLDKPTDSINNVVWTFDAVPFTASAANGTPDSFKAVGYRDGKVIGEDTAAFTTTAK